MTQTRRSAADEALPESSSPATKLAVVGLALALTGATLWAYQASWDAPFIFDDYRNIVDNHRVRRWQPLTELGREARALLFISLQANYAFGELDETGYHAVNLTIHVIAGLALMGVVRRSLLLPQIPEYLRRRATWWGFAVAALWTLHPLQTQSVTYLVQRCEAMMGMFFLLCLYCVVCGSQSRRSWAWYGAAVAACWLGMASKQVMIVAPLVVPIYDRVFLCGSWSQLLVRRGAMYAAFLPAVAWLVAQSVHTATASETAHAGFGQTSVGPWPYLLTQSEVILHYLRLAAWPEPLCIDYRWPAVDSMSEVVLPGLAVCGLLLAAVAGLGWAPRVAFLAVSFFLVLAPSSSVLPIEDLAVEHRMYLPLACATSLAVLALAAAIELGLTGPLARDVARVGFPLLAALSLAAATRERNRDYAEPATLWGKCLAVNPRNDRAWYNLAKAVEKQGKREQAIAHLRRSIELNPNYAPAHNSLAVHLAATGDVEGAAKHYEMATKVDPGDSMAWTNYGNLYARQGDFPKALPLFRRAVESDPQRADAYLALSLAQVMSQDWSGAVKTMRRAHAALPQSEPITLRLARLLATAEDDAVRDAGEAIRLIEAATAAGMPQSVQSLDIVSAAYAEAGQFDQAAAALQRALALLQQLPDYRDPPHLRRRLERYRQGQRRSESDSSAELNKATQNSAGR